MTVSSSIMSYEINWREEPKDSFKLKEAQQQIIWHTLQFLCAEQVIWVGPKSQQQAAQPTPLSLSLLIPIGLVKGTKQDHKHKETRSAFIDVERDRESSFCPTLFPFGRLAFTGHQHMFPLRLSLNIQKLKPPPFSAPHTITPSSSFRFLSGSVLPQLPLISIWFRPVSIKSDTDTHTREQCGWDWWLEEAAGRWRRAIDVGLELGGAWDRELGWECGGWRRGVDLGRPRWRRAVAWGSSGRRRDGHGRTRPGRYPCHILS